MVPKLTFINTMRTPTLSIARLLSLVDDIGQKTTEIVIEKSKTDLLQQFCAVASAALIEDWSALRNAVHSISGISATIGAEKLRNLASEVEDNCLDLNYSKASLRVADVMLETMTCIEGLENVNLSVLISNSELDNARIQSIGGQ